MARALSTTIGRTIGKFFAHPAGKATGFVATAVGGVVAERVAEKAGYVEKASDLVVSGLQFAGLAPKKKEAAKPANDAPAPPSEKKSAEVGSFSPFIVGHGGPGCDCNKKDRKSNAPPCTGCTKATVANYIAGVKKLPEFSIVAEAAKTNPEVRTALAEIGFGTDPNWVDTPSHYVVQLPNGKSVDFGTKDHYLKWLGENQEINASANVAKKNAQKVLDAQKKSYQNRIAALQRQLAAQADAASKKATADQIAALQAQLLAAQQVPALNQLPVTASQQLLTTAANGSSMSDMIQQLMQFKMLENVMQQPQGQNMPWGGPGAEMVMDPGSGQPMVYDQSSGQGYPSQDDEFQQWTEYSLSGASEEDLTARFDTSGVADDFAAMQTLDEVSTIEGGDAVSELTTPTPTNDLDMGEEPVSLDDEMDCEPCNTIY